MAWSTAQWKRLAVDVGLTITAIIFLSCSFWGVIKPQHRGFHCDDRTIKHAYHGDTITLGCLLTINLAIPLFVFIVVETWNYNGAGCSPLPTKGFRPFLRNLGRVSLDYFLGMVFTLYLTEFMKLLVSELRPHFMDTCRPNVNPIRCSEGYITNYTCSSSYSASIINDSFKSFPSGHASSSFYASIFLALYVHIRARKLVSRLVNPWLQLGFMSWGIYCSISRITDNRHHWWDVCIGAMMGAGVGYASVAMLTQWFRTPKRSLQAPVEDPGNKPANRISSGRLLSSTSSAEQKEAEETVAIKDLKSNHIR